ncbi:MAG: TonB-dependent receptor [Amphiplicatus sp.]
MVQAARCVVASLIMFVACARISVAQEEGARVYFNVPALQAEQAVKQIAAQANRAVLFRTDTLVDVRANPVTGYFTVDEALESLFFDTPLQGSLTRKGAIIVSLRNAQEAEGNMHTENDGKKIKTGLLVWLASLVATSGHAQEAGGDAESHARDVIVVTTARRQAEDIQDVPLTVTALSANELKQQGITRAVDLQFAAPSVNVGPGFGRLDGGYTVRGLNAGVVTYFNEAPGGPSEVGLPFFDIASVEILNGPQGTLFGRTGAAGAVLITPKAPDLDSFGGYVDVVAGNFDRIQASTAFNLPLVAGALALRVAYQHEHIDGFTEQLSGGPALDSSHNDSVRATLKWRRGGFDNSLIANFINVDQTPPGWVLTAIDPSPLAIPPAFAPFVFGSVCGQAVAKGLETSTLGCVANRLSRIQTLQSELIAENARLQNGGDEAVRFTRGLGDVPAVQLYRHFSVMDVAQYDFGDIGPTTLSVKNILSMQRRSSVASQGLDGFGGALLALGFSNVGGAPSSVNQIGNMVDVQRGPASRLYTEEFQLHGVAADMINWTAGLYYQKSKTPEDLEGVATMTRVLSGLFTQNRGWAPAFPFQAGSNSSELAGYGQVTIDLDEIGIHGLSVTGGYRHTTSKVTSRSVPALPNPSGTGPVIPAMVPNVDVVATESQGSNYTAAITEEITPDFLVYASTSKSFTPGGVNTALGCNLAPNCTPTFEPQKVVNYEFGVKSDFDFGDFKLRLNADIYRMDFTNIQRGFQITVGAVSTAFTQNVAEARMQGLETHLDMVWREGVNLTVNYAYLDAGYREWIGQDSNLIILPTDTCLAGSNLASGLCFIDLSDNPFANAPSHQANATLRYRLPVLEETQGELWLSMTGYYQTREYVQGTGKRLLEVAAARGLDVDLDDVSQRGYGKLNARLEWSNINGSGFTAALFADNLTNKTFSQTGGSNLFTLGTAFKLYEEPRMWGVNLRYDFGG